MKRKDPGKVTFGYRVSWIFSACTWGVSFSGVDLKRTKTNI